MSEKLFEVVYEALIGWALGYYICFQSAAGGSEVGYLENFHFYESCPMQRLCPGGTLHCE